MPEAAGRASATFRARAARRLPSGRDDRGQAVVEFALVLPVLLLLILGIIKGGILYNNYLQLTDAVRSGARALAIERGQTSPCGDAAGSVITAAGGLNGNQITMTMTENPDPNSPPSTYTSVGTSGSGTCPTLVSGSATTLKATYPCDLAFLGVDFIPGCKLSASATERVE
jgi:Flp pilus assembly protein TadG